MSIANLEGWVTVLGVICPFSNFALRLQRVSDYKISLDLLHDLWIPWFFTINSSFRAKNAIHSFIPYVRRAPIASSCMGRLPLFMRPMLFSLHICAHVNQIYKKYMRQPSLFNYPDGSKLSPLTAETCQKDSLLMISLSNLKRLWNPGIRLSCRHENMIDLDCKSHKHASYSTCRLQLCAMTDCVK